MNAKKYSWILYLISATIIITIAIQFYWNYKNYEENKQRVLNEIQISLDNSIEAYYANLSKQNFFAIVESENSKNKDNKKKIWREFLHPVKKKNKDSINIKVTSISIDLENKDLKKTDSNFVDSISKEYLKPRKTPQFSKDRKRRLHLEKLGNLSEVRVFKGKKSTDSLKLVKGIQTVFIALHNDSINYKHVDSIFVKELENKGITSQYSFKHIINDSLLFDDSPNNQTSFIKIDAKSTYFKPNEKFQLVYRNPTLEALKRSFTGILLSLLLSAAVIASLFYLLHIINHQKELVAIKNDLISNITHEFKTPITTVSAAIEALDSFNMMEDKVKTKKYLSISSAQLKKLHLMVEKLLETATLDSEKLMLKKEDINLIDLVERITKRYQLIAPKKNILFSSSISQLEKEVDVFHFENAISNLIENAVKYGGDAVEININYVLNNLEISIADNGKGIEKNQQEKIFDKFYRVPKGNTHDVKGFGIGLYYTKKIIEKHSGTISINSNQKQTVFKIILPND